jgi:hypothetical protein
MAENRQKQIAQKFSLCANGLKDKTDFHACCLTSI